MRSALLVVDVQLDYFVGGKYCLMGTDSVCSNIRILLDYARRVNVPVVYMKHITGANGSLLVEGTDGAEIHPALSPKCGEKVLKKHYPNSFRDTSLLSYLNDNQITRLIVCGMMTDVSIDATVRAAKDLGFTVVVIGDACATRDRFLYGQLVKAKRVQEACLAGLEAMESFYATVMTTIGYLDSLRYKGKD